MGGFPGVSPLAILAATCTSVSNDDRLSPAEKTAEDERPEEMSEGEDEEAADEDEEEDADEDGNNYQTLDADAYQAPELVTTGVSYPTITPHTAPSALYPLPRHFLETALTVRAHKMCK